MIPLTSLYVAEQFRKHGFIPYYVTKVDLSKVPKNNLRSALLTGVYPGAHTVSANVYRLLAANLEMPTVVVWKSNSGGRYGRWVVYYKRLPPDAEKLFHDYHDTDMVALQLSDPALVDELKQHSPNSLKRRDTEFSIYSEALCNLKKLREITSSYAVLPWYREKARAAIEMLESGAGITVKVQ